MSVIPLFGAEPTATFSDDGMYRYDLTRTWGDERRVAWVLLNPSTATAETDDPTIRRCIGFSKAWGYGGLVVLNLFAYRATNPRELRACADPVGPDNDTAIDLWISNGLVERVVAAWGVHGTLHGRGTTVLERIAHTGRTIHCLGTTAADHPRHPLYVHSATDVLTLR